METIAPEPFADRLRKAAALTKLQSVTSYLEQAKDGTTPSQAASKLFRKTFALQRWAQRFALKKDLYEGHGELTQDDLDVVASTGSWSRRPSDLFLKVYADALLTLQRDPLAGVVSPPLIGSEGTVPLSIVSVIPDIMQHYYDCIVRAEHEVILLTNYWQPSDSVTKIGNAMRELSKRQAAKGKKVVFKLLIDRGALKQIINPHVPVPSSEWEPLKIPLPHEIPNVQLEVQNYHRLLLGTMHTKFLVVDRKVTLINSNNIQDRPNLEMMIHLEGPIVQSFYDTGLLTWFEKMHPPLPLLKQPLPKPEYLFAEDNPYLADIDLVRAARAAKALLHKQVAEAKVEGQARRAKSGQGSGFGDVVIGAMQKAKANPEKGSIKDKLQAAIVKAKSQNTDPVKEDSNGHRPEESGSPTTAPSLAVTAPTPNATAPSSPAPAQSPVAPYNAVSRPEEDDDIPMALPQNRISVVKPVSPDNGHASPARPRTNRARAGSNVSVISNPGVAASPPRSPGSTKATTAASKSTAPTSLMPSSEAEGQDLSNTEMTSTSFLARMKHLSNNFNRGANAPTKASLPIELYDDNWQFAPHRFHKHHKPVPIALVNRKPHGMPGHADIRNPQDAAWLAALRYAQKHVFIQTPTLNAKKIREAILAACRRKVKVILYIDLGFNDKSEGGVPFQGGTNQEVVKKLYAALEEAYKPFLELYWYTGADQRRPLHAIHKRRNCHVKFLSVDSAIAIVGNGNQDTQSWCHSQEVNILIDSEQIVLDWENMLAANQNTGRFGRTGNDGIWRDKEGKTVEQLDTIELAALTDEEKAETHATPVEHKAEPLRNDAA